METDTISVFGLDGDGWLLGFSLSLNSGSASLRTYLGFVLQLPSMLGTSEALSALRLWLCWIQRSYCDSILPPSALILLENLKSARLGGSVDSL